jgi:hypothetical protein
MAIASAALQPRTYRDGLAWRMAHVRPPRRFQGLPRFAPYGLSLPWDSGPFAMQGWRAARSNSCDDRRDVCAFEPSNSTTRKNRGTRPWENYRIGKLRAGSFPVQK